MKDSESPSKILAKPVLVKTRPSNQQPSKIGEGWELGIRMNSVEKEGYASDNEESKSKVSSAPIENNDGNLKIQQIRQQLLLCKKVKFKYSTVLLSYIPK